MFFKTRKVFEQENSRHQVLYPRHHDDFDYKDYLKTENYTIGAYINDYDNLFSLECEDNLAEEFNPFLKAVFNSFLNHVYSKKIEG